MKSVLIGSVLFVALSGTQAFAASRAKVKLCEAAVREYSEEVQFEQCLKDSLLERDARGNPQITLLICGDVGEYVTFKLEPNGEVSLLNRDSDDACRE